MRTFTDSASRRWEIILNVGSIRRVKDVSSINLVGVVEEGLLERLYRDPLMLCDILWWLCERDAIKQSITREAFEGSLWGDVLDNARKALLEELADFFPSPKDRENLRLMMTALENAILEAQNAVSERLRDPNLFADLANLLSAANATSGSAPELSESIQVGLPSVSLTQ